MNYLDLVSLVKKNGDNSLLSLYSTMNCAVLRLIDNDEPVTSSSKENLELKNKILLADLLSNGFFVATLENVNFKADGVSISYEMSYFVLDLAASRDSLIMIKEIASRKNVKEFVYIPKLTFVNINHLLQFKDNSSTVINTKSLLFEYKSLVDIHKPPCSGFGHISMHRFAMKECGDNPTN